MGRASQILEALQRRLFPEVHKKSHELNYWKARKQIEGDLGNDHYRYFYTEHFGLTSEDYAGKTILDIGCGPRGSLEWANQAGRRIGLDPLAKEYQRLGADRHQMEYLAAPSENIPLPDGVCDIVCAFNSLDHVRDVKQSVLEIKRITRQGGLFLLLVAINHPPTSCEPHCLSPELLADLAPEFICERVVAYERREDGIYHSIMANKKIAEPMKTREPFYLSARLSRT